MQGEDTTLAQKRAELKTKKEQQKSSSSPKKFDAAIATLTKEIEDISSGIVRIGGDAPIAMASIANYVTLDLLRYAMDQTIAAGRKIVEVGSLHSGDLTQISVWPLIRTLPAIKNYDAETEEALRKERAAANKAAKAARLEAKKTNGAAAKAEEPAPSSTMTTFNTYVDNATKAVKKDEAYKAMRVSNRLREVISLAVAELVSSLSKMARVAVLELLHVRTLTASHLKSLVKILYVSEDEDSSLSEYVQEKLDLYNAHLKSEKARKWDQMDDLKKAELEMKTLAAETARKEKRAADARATAIKAAQLAKRLAAELKSGGK